MCLNIPQRALPALLEQLIIMLLSTFTLILLGEVGINLLAVSQLMATTIGTGLLWGAIYRELRVGWTLKMILAPVVWVCGIILTVEAALFWLPKTTIWEMSKLTLSALIFGVWCLRQLFGKQKLFDKSRIFKISLIILLGLFFLPPFSARAQTHPVGCQPIYQDPAGNGLLNMMVLQGCTFATKNDTVSVIRNAGVMDPSKDWQSNLDFENSMWIFDAGSRGKASLIIQFYRDESGLVADLFDDQDGDGRVNYIWEDGKPVIKESGLLTHLIFPPVRVIAPDGWWTRGELVNYNLKILLDGRMRGAFFTSEFIQANLSPNADGIPEFEVTIRDVNQDGRPDYDLRQVRYFIYTGQLSTALMVNQAMDEPPAVDGAVFWPHLGGRAEIVKPYNGSPAPIQIDWGQAKVYQLGEFVAGRGGDSNWFVYSIAQFGPGYGSLANFENPFAFYNLAGVQDGYPDLTIRTEYSEPNAAFFLRGSYPRPVDIIRYSWNQFHGSGQPNWDFGVQLLGQHLVEGVVSFPDFEVRTTPYPIYPSWVIERAWDVAAFIANEQQYWSTEGIYEGYSRQVRDEYLTGRADKPELVGYIPQPGMRIDFNIEYQRQVNLYISPVDGKLHLRDAAQGQWKVGEKQWVDYADQNQDGYFDYWQAFSGRQLSQTLALAEEYLIYGDQKRVALQQVALPLAAFESPPPHDPASYTALQKAVIQWRKDLPPGDLEALFNSFAGQALVLDGVRLQNVRFLPGGFRLELEADDEGQISAPFTVGGLGNRLAAGEYLYQYIQGEHKIQPLTPAESVFIPGVHLIPETAQALSPVKLTVTMQNVGMQDINAGEVRLYDPTQQSVTLVATQTVNLPGGESLPVTFFWTPKLSGEIPLRLELRQGLDKMLAAEMTETIPVQSSLPVESSSLRAAFGFRLGWWVSLLLLAILVSLRLVASRGLLLEAREKAELSTDGCTTRAGSEQNFDSDL